MNTQPGDKPEPKPENPYSAPMSETSGFSPAFVDDPNAGDATGGLIPYKNPHALIAYYLGIVALVPLIGMPFGIASIILGISGLKKRKANPVIKGSAHAIIGICGGVFSLLCGGGMILAIIFAMVNS